MYHLLIDGAQNGPYTETEVRAMAAQGQLGIDPMYWQEGMADWRPLTERISVAHPEPRFAASTPPPPTPPRQPPMPAMSSAAKSVHNRHGSQGMGQTFEPEPPLQWRRIGVMVLFMVFVITAAAMITRVTGGGYSSTSTYPRDTYNNTPPTIPRPEVLTRLGPLETVPRSPQASPPAVHVPLEGYALHRLNDGDGREIHAQVGSLDELNVTLTVDGNTSTYPMKGLSEASQRFVRRLDRMRKLEKPLPLPVTGVLLGQVAQSELTGPLTIRTRSGSGNYFVKLVQQSTGAPVITAFIRDGGTVHEMVVPPGTYELRYATGQDWYGEKYLFGDETAYAKADSVFVIGHGQGYTVELFLQVDGNLRTSAIQEDNF